MAEPDLPGVGPAALVPKLAPGVKLSELQLRPEAGFVLSRVDGRTSLGELCQLVPFDRSTTAQLVLELAECGAIELPGGQVRKKAAAAAPATAPPPAHDGHELTPEQVLRIDAYHADLAKRDAYALLEVAPNADKRDIKRAYFRLSKEFHPDRFYGKKTGPYGDKLNAIFQAVKSAFELLSNDTRRAAYDESK
jgi:hypothetical protein